MSENGDMSEKYEVYSDIVGDDAKRGRISFTAQLDAAEWDILRKKVLRMLDQGHKQWEFDLTELRFCSSTDIGMWVMMNATIANREGSAWFKVPPETPLSQVLTITHLDRILTLKAA